MLLLLLLLLDTSSPPLRFTDVRANLGIRKHGLGMPGHEAAHQANMCILLGVGLLQLRGLTRPHVAAALIVIEQLSGRVASPFGAAVSPARRHRACLDVQKQPLGIGTAPMRTSIRSEAAALELEK